MRARELIYEYTVIFEPAEEGRFVVHVPALPGCITEGDSLREARRMAKDAIRCYLQSLAKDGQDIPVESPTPAVVQEKVVVSFP